MDLVAGYEIYGGPALVIDYGTATTYDIVTENGVFLAGVIAPGIRTSANVLYRDAARLPEIEILKPKTILANSTIAVCRQVCTMELLVRQNIWYRR